MNKFNFDKTLKPVGPYSLAIKTGNLLYCSGQTPIDPQTNQIETSDIESQTRRVIQNLALVLREAGLNLSAVVKTNVFITDLENFKKMNAIYIDCFEGHLPARTTIAVKGLPYNALVEIECIAEFSLPTN
jgi:2-iminobutanoate/2-iminopropanoate deaminase